MTRTRQFCPDAALESVLSIFRLKGYKNCSMADIVEASGVARYGLYQEFGDKDELYRTVLKRYQDMMNSGFLANLRLLDAGFDAITEHFDSILTMIEQGNRDGCFACQAASERAYEDPQVDAIVRDTFSLLESAYKNALSNAIAAGDVRNMPRDPKIQIVD